MKRQLLDRVAGLLEESGFAVSDCGGSRSCFDFVARRRGMLLLVKVLGNIEGLTSNTSHELRKVASITGGVPIVVGERLKLSNLMDGVLYERYGVRAMNASTMRDVLSNEMPVAHSIRGNYCARVNSGMLRRLRNRLDLTQEELAKELGVSKQSVYRYESTGTMLFNVMEKMLDIFDDERLLLHENPLSHGRYEEERDFNMHVADMKKVVAGKLKTIGFSISMTNAPFDVVAREDETVYTVVSNDQRRLENKIRLVGEVTNMIGGHGLCVTERHLSSEQDVAVLSPEDLDEFRRPSELIGRILKKHHF